jgi:hypothetical protein
MQVVQIVGAPVTSCREGVTTWREVADWAARELGRRFGDQIAVRYYELFDPDCPSFPEGCALPVVLVNQQLVSSGGKISIPLIRRHLETLIGRDVPAGGN